jgi:hypothetical protein
MLQNNSHRDLLSPNTYNSQTVEFHSTIIYKLWIVFCEPIQEVSHIYRMPSFREN